MFNYMELSNVKRFINFDGITQTNKSVKEEYYYIYNHSFNNQRCA